MDPAVSNETKADFLPLASLRFLVSPLQLLSASMWQIVKQKDVLSFWKVSEFVSFLMSTVPELLLLKQWVQLTLGLRARFILELCRRGEDTQLILSHLENMKLQPTALQLSDEQKVAEEFTATICALLKDNQQRQIIFQEVWCEEFGSEFDADLQTLFWEFLCRLNQLLPVPELEQTVLWLGETTVLVDFLQCISENMKNLLLHHKHLGHLDQQVSPSSMGDHISSSLAAALRNRPSKLEENPNLEAQSGPLSGSHDDLQSTSFVEESTMEIFTEIELTTAGVQVVVIENTTPNQQNGETCEITLAEEVVKENRTMGKKNRSAILNNQALKSSSDVEVLFLDNTTLNGVDVEETVIALKANDSFKNLKNSEEMREDFPSAVVKSESVVTACSGKEVVFIDNTTAKDEIGEVTMIALKENATRDMEESRAMEEHNVLAIFKDKSQVTSPKRTPTGPHNCPDCGKKFKFASFLVAHRVIHTGERPHKCSKCGQCFSFRQSLERHRHTHKTSRNLEMHSEINNTEITEVNGEQGTSNVKENSEEKEHELAEEQSKKANDDFKASANRAIDSRLMNDVISLVQVRTSRRKRKATKKMRNLQKKLERKKEAEKVTDGGPNTVQLTKSSDHSYGTNTNSSEDVHKGAVEKGPSHSCPHCGYCHSEEAEIQQHIKKSHCTTADAQPFTKTTAGDTEENKAGRIFKCSVCGQLFQTSKDHKDHFAAAHMQNGVFFCSRCGKNFTWKAAFVRHVRMYCSQGRTDSLACPRCELAFDCSSTLYSHIQTHHEGKVHACSCGKSFSCKASLTAHERTHQKERPHVCLQCGKGFLYKSALLSHMAIHSEERPFACSHCGKSFKRERNMKKHLRCHTREDVFKCSQCDKSFVYKATLTRHELTHTGERPYLCSDCGKGFFSHAELLKHERFHTGRKPFECPHCGKRFTQSCYLTVHLRYHTGAKPYACSDCEKSFLSANRLKIHQRIHTGEKPYVCGECGKRFKQSYHLKLHRRTHIIDLT